MGTVYLAREHAAERTVAMKILHSPTSRNAFDRFLVEARVLARLDHPNIIKVVSVETNWREPFLTMEYADGGSLADLVKPGEPLPAPSDAARLVLGAAEAIAAAHNAGVLHRDIKPSNILLAGREVVRARAGEKNGDVADPTPPPRLLATPKVSDFGLAKRTDRDDGLTRTGPIGTPGYMSPEAAAGRYREVAAASDVYGLGATLYQLLTGRPPFTGSCVEEILQKVLSDPPVRPRALRPDLPAGLEAIVVKAMAKEPASRYPTATALATDLRRFLAGETTHAPVLSPLRRAWRWLVRRRVRAGAAAAVVALIAALIALGIWLAPTPPPPPDADQILRDEIATGKPVSLIDADGQPRSAAWPLGSEITAADATDGTCSFDSRDARILLLLNDPGVERYRVRAEICQKAKYANVRPGQGNLGNAKTDRVGLILSYAVQNGANGTRVHSMVVLDFSDYDRADGPAEHLDFRYRAFVENIARGTMGDHSVYGPSTATLVRPGPNGPAWQTIVAEVTPDGITVPEHQPIDAATITRMRVTLGQDRNQVGGSRAGPVALPDWSPRMPMGIWLNDSKVLVRNVTIEALK